MNQWYIEHYRSERLREAENERLIRSIKVSDAIRNLPAGLRRRLTALKNQR